MEYEQVLSLFHIQSIEEMTWDGLSEVLCLKVRMGPVDESRSLESVVTLSPEAAEQLAAVLPQALEERPDAGAPMQ